MTVSTYRRCADRRLSVGLVLAVWAAVLTAAPAGAAIIRFKPNAEVATAIIHLGDVADIIDADPQHEQRLKQIALRPAPAEGRTVQLDFDSIRSRLQAHGVNLAQTEFTGRSSVMVSSKAKQEKVEPKSTGADRPPFPRGPAAPPSLRVSDMQYRRAQTQLAEAAEHHIRRNAPELGKLKVAVQFNREQTPQILEASAAGFEIRGGRPPFAGDQTLTVRFVDRQHQIRELDVTCRAETYPQVWAVRHAVSSGHILQRGDLIPVQVADPAGYIEHAQHVAGLETKRPVGQGSPLKMGDLQRVPLVRSGDVVTVYSRGGGVSVARPFKARSDGMLGDTVNLVTLDGKQRIVGRVIGLHEAEIINRGSSLSDIFSDSSGRIEFQTQ